MALLDTGSLVPPELLVAFASAPPGGMFRDDECAARPEPRRVTSQRISCVDALARALPTAPRYNCAFDRSERVTVATT